MKKHFKIKHQILQILAKFQDSFPVGTSSNDRLLDDLEIEIKFRKFIKKYLLDILHDLTTTKDIHCTMEFENSKFLIPEDGRAGILLL
jgi:hypothetical protein